MLKLLLVCLLVSIMSPVHALLLPAQAGIHEPASLAGHLMALRDPGGLLRIEDLLAQHPDANFVPLPGFLAAGFTRDVYWLRFTLQRTGDATDHWYLEVAPSFLDDVTLYAPGGDGHYQAARLGDLQPYSARPVQFRNFIFPLTLPEAQLTYYLRVKTTSTMLVRVLAWQYPGLLLAAQTDTGIYSAYFGLIVLAFLTNLVFWLWLRDRIYVSYCAYVAMLGLVMMATGGFISQWLLPNSPVLADRLVGIVLCLTYLIRTYFFIVVLRLRSHFPRINRGFDIVLGFYALCTLCAIAGFYTVVAPWLQMVVLVINSSVAFAGPWLLWRGHKEYLLYTLAFTASFIAVLIALFRLLGWLSINTPSDYITMLGTIIHIVLLNIAVADRVRRSERKLLDAETKTALLGIERENLKLQRQFVAMVSHEFRTPLAVIDATAQSVEIGCAQTGSTSYAFIAPRQEKIRRAVRRMVSLLDNFLTSERLDVQSVDINCKSLDLRELATEAAKSWHHLLSAPDQLILDIDNQPIMVFVDRAMLTLALSNLIDNAMKYSRAGSPITLRAYKKQGYGWIEVEDQGQGISADALGKIYDKFYRSSDAMAVPGAGLGLYLVREIVGQHGGEITVVSQEGQGTLFHLRLPLTVQV